MKNTFNFDPTTGDFFAVLRVQASGQYQCACGQKIDFTVEWPEGVVQTGTVTITDSRCPQCHQPVVLPFGKHWVEDFRLRSAPLDV